MKKLLIFLIYIFLLSVNSYAKPDANSLRLQVDERLELLSIACRLADVKGFNESNNPVYEKAIGNYFSKYKTHSLVKYLAESKTELDTDYWEIPALAAHLSQPPKLEPLVSFDDTKDVDGWESRKLFTSKMVSLIQQFYKDANAEAFFKSQANYYKQINQQYEKQSPKINKDWLEKFFNLPATENYYAVVAPGLPDGAYLRVNFSNNRRDTYTIFAINSFDKNGIPNKLSSVSIQRANLHEYVHAFTNQLVDKNLAALQRSSETLLNDPKVFALMKDTFYGNWQYLLYESMVRAAAVKYLAANETDKSIAENEIARQEKLGFFWIRNLVGELDRYEKRRAKYKNIEQFMPKIIDFFNSEAEKLRR
jgi:hypothetical protein